MITDSQTNFLYLAASLKKIYPSFFNELEKVLIDCHIPYEFLTPTKDVWAVDYMPVQIEKNKFVQFVYNPDYLSKYNKWRKTISDVEAICKEINIIPEKTDILLDGGNVVRAKDKVIITDKVFIENPAIQQKDLIKRLEKILETDRIVFVPRHPLDFTGHADGIVRFLNNNTVLINAGSEKATQKEKEFELSLRLALHNACLDYIEIPSDTSGNTKNKEANGEYLNYLQMENVIILPVFGIEKDDIVEKKFKELFSGIKIATVNSNDIAKEGGILNCISWNIVK
jgi:agmatine deiminase